MGDEIRVTLIATGFDKRARTAGGYCAVRRARERAASRGPGRPRPRGSTIAQRSSLEISDDDIDIPPFLR